MLIRRWVFLLPPPSSTTSTEPYDMVCLGITPSGSLLFSQHSPNIHEERTFRFGTDPLPTTDIHILGVLSIHSNHPYGPRDTCTMLNVFSVNNDENGMLIFGQVLLRGAMAVWHSSLHPGDIIEVMDFVATHRSSSISSSPFELVSRSASTLSLLHVCLLPNRLLSNRASTMSTQTRAQVQLLTAGYQFIQTNIKSIR